MLLESGDLIPVLREAADIPWTKRKAQISQFLHRGYVNFSTFVYDTNVGDIAPLSTYFSPYHWTIDDLNFKFGIITAHNVLRETVMRTSPANVMDGDEAKRKSIQPKLIIYLPEEMSDRESVLSFPGSQSSDTETVWSEKTSAWCQDCKCCSQDELARPKPRLPSKPSQDKQPNSPDSPVRSLWAISSYEDRDASIFRHSAGLSRDSLEPIGPPKRRKVTTSPVKASNSCWLLTSDNNGGFDDVKTSFLSMFSEDSLWSPWASIKSPKSKMTETQEQEFVSSLRRIAAQPGMFYSPTPSHPREVLQNGSFF